MTCKHKPQFSIKNIYAKKPQFICAKCGADLEMNTMTHAINRALNAVVVATLFFKVLSGGASGTLKGFAIFMGTMLLYVLVYILAYMLLIQFGRYTEKVISPADAAAMKIVTDAKMAEANKPASVIGQPGENNATDQVMSQEQIDLMALYQSYAEKETGFAAEGGSSSTGSKSNADGNAPIMSDTHAHLLGETCLHKPVKTWKIYIPTYLTFTCANCGQPITFAASTKKSMNVIIMVVILMILMPSFMNNDVNSLEYALLTLLAFAVAAVIQYYFLIKGHYEIRKEVRKPENKKRR